MARCLSWQPPGKGADVSTFYDFPMQILSAVANVAASQTDSSLVTAVTGKRVVVLGLVMIAGVSATDVTFNSKPSGSGTAISPLFANGANGGAVLPPNGLGYFQTNSGEGLTV